MSKRGSVPVLLAVDQAQQALTKVLLELVNDRELLARAARAERSRQATYSRFDAEGAGWADVRRVSECLYVLQVLRRTYEAACVDEEREPRHNEG